MVGGAMTEPVSWLALEAIKARLATILTADGYATDLGEQPIALDRTQHVGNGAYTTVVAGEITVAEQASGPRTTVSDMDVTIEYALPSSTPAPGPELLAHRARADIVRALGAAVRGDAAGFRSLRVTGSRIVSAVEPGTSLIIAQVSCVAGLVESRPPAT
jgi:hypothetical protein